MVFIEMFGFFTMLYTLGFTLAGVLGLATLVTFSNPKRKAE